MSGKGVRDFVESYARFSFTDPFGIGRLRELAYSFKMRERDLESELSYLRDVNNEQSKAVTLMVQKLSAVEKINENLSSYISKSDEAKRSLNEKKLLAEAEKLRMTDEFESMREELDRLKDIEKHYTQLSSQYAALVQALREARPDIPIDILEDQMA